MSDLKEILAALSEEIRLRIIVLLENSTLCVNCFIRVFDLPQSTVSRHLSVLRKSGLVKVTRGCTNNYYSIRTEEPFRRLKQQLIETYRQTLRDTEPFKSDLKKLYELKDECTADCKIQIVRKRKEVGK